MAAVPCCGGPALPRFSPQPTPCSCGTREGPGPPGQLARPCWLFMLVLSMDRWSDLKSLALPFHCGGDRLREGLWPPPIIQPSGLLDPALRFPASEARTLQW